MNDSRIEQSYRKFRSEIHVYMFFAKRCAGTDYHSISCVEYLCSCSIPCSAGDNIAWRNVLWDRTRNDIKLLTSSWHGDRRLATMPKFLRHAYSKVPCSSSVFMYREQDFRTPESSTNKMQLYGNCGIRKVNLATSKNVVAKIKMFPYRNIHKYT
jgi:hypothetical protein